MPRKKKSPSYLLHRATLQARVRRPSDGKWFYLGPFGSPKSKRKHESLVAKWLAEEYRTAQQSPVDDVAEPLTVDILCAVYMEHVERYYRKNGEPTSEVYNIRLALRYVVDEFGESLAADFGPKKLKVVRQAMIAARCVRTSINRMIHRVRGMFAWAVSEELLAETVYRALLTIKALEEGRSAAVESEPVRPVPQAYIDAVRPYVSGQVWAAIQLQVLTGARPGEVLAMRGCDLNMSGTVWEYTPAAHKSQHRGKQRIIHLGPQAQRIVREFLRADLTAFLFSPWEAREEYLAALRASRKTPLTPSQRARQRKTHLKKQPGNRYTVVSYGRAIRNACKQADRKARNDRPEVPADETIIPNWHPHQLRHNAATELRRQFGIEATRTVLGHSSVVTSEMYAEMDSAKAREIAAAVG